MQPSLRRCYERLRDGAAVLDVGCLGFRQVENAQSLGLNVSHAGVDCLPRPSDLPRCFDYRQADVDREPIPFADDSFDLVVVAHVLEHLRRQVEAVAECLRLCRPGGCVYVEAPSERSLWLPGMPFGHDDFRSLSFFDDPTHVGRPWTP